MAQTPSERKVALSPSRCWRPALTPGLWRPLAVNLQGWVPCGSGRRGVATYRYLWGPETGWHLSRDEYVRVLTSSVPILAVPSWIPALGQFRQTHFRSHHLNQKAWNLQWGSGGRWASFFVLSSDLPRRRFMGSKSPKGQNPQAFPFGLSVSHLWRAQRFQRTSPSHSWKPRLCSTSCLPFSCISGYNSTAVQEPGQGRPLKHSAACLNWGKSQLLLSFDNAREIGK